MEKRKFLFSFITPTKFIKSFGIQGDFILALSHLIDMNEITNYEEAIRTTGLPIHLDNGLFENEAPENLESLIDKARKIKASVVFSPDYLYNAKKTKEQINITCQVMKEKKINTDINTRRIKLGAVVQANNKKDWIEQYIDFTNDERIDVIGLSILSIPKSFGGTITDSRIECINALLSLKIKHKDCHLLGLGSSYADIKLAIEKAPFIKSNDSSSCFTTGFRGFTYEGKNLAVPGGKQRKKLDFNLEKLNNLQMECIYKNIKMVKAL